MSLLSAAQGVLLDLDGTLFRGEEAIPGAVAFMETLQALEKPFLYWTNNSTRSPKEVAAHLEGLGFAAKPEQVYTSSQALIDLLAERLDEGDPVYVVGEQGLQTAVREAGWRDLAHMEAATDESAKAVLVGLDRTSSYQSLAGALTHLLRGADFYATNNDRVLPTHRGLMPGAGAVLAFLETAALRSAKIAGKPSADFVTTAAGRLGIDAKETLVVGDNLLTDVLAAKRAGSIGVWVCTGVPGDVAELPLAERPDYTIQRLLELLA
ncbi:MAG: HAD-IIA family hydrolase [Firmicutes bacterium]|nr:HAD-IIA family hydrolase [Bacillota bacterium]